MASTMVEVTCKNCGETRSVGVTLPPRDPCRCGLTESVRIARALVMGLVSLVLLAFGGCWISHYYTTEQVKAVKGVGYEVVPNDAIPPNPQWDVVPVPSKKDVKR